MENNAIINKPTISTPAHEDFNLSSCRNLEVFKQKISNVVKDLGFTEFLFIRLERTWHIESQYGMLYSLPNELMRMYHEGKLHTSDLLLEYGKCNSQPIFSSQIYNYIGNSPFEIELTSANRRVTQLYKRFGIFEHVVIPMPATNGNGHVQMLLTKSGADIQQLQALTLPIMNSCLALCKAIDMVSTKNFRSTFIEQKDNPLRITRKPLQILQHLANQDITITDLASQLHVSPITAHQHIAAARKALNVKTNIGAIVKAISAGLIHLN